MAARGGKLKIKEAGGGGWGGGAQRLPPDALDVFAFVVLFLSFLAFSLCCWLQEGAVNGFNLNPNYC